MQQRCRPPDGAAAGDWRQDETVDWGTGGKVQGLWHAPERTPGYVPHWRSSLTFTSVICNHYRFCKCRRHSINDAISVPGLQNEMEKLEDFVQGNCSAKSELWTCVGTLWSVMSVFSFLPDLQKKVKVDEDAPQASESKKHFLLPLLRPLLFIIFYSFN